MRLPPEIPRGQPYWKKRQQELLIMQCMRRATKPNTGWDIYQKIKRFTSMNGDDICKLMYELSENGYLHIAGTDTDCGYSYELPKT